MSKLFFRVAVNLQILYFPCAHAAGNLLIDIISSQAMEIVLGSKGGGKFLEAIVGEKLTRQLKLKEAPIEYQRRALAAVLLAEENAAIGSEFVLAMRTIFRGPREQLNLRVENSAKALQAFREARFERANEISGGVIAPRLSIAKVMKQPEPSLKFLESAKTEIQRRVDRGELTDVAAVNFIATARSASAAMKAEVLGAGANNCVATFRPKAVQNLMLLIDGLNAQEIRNGKSAAEAIVARASEVFGESMDRARRRICSLTAGTKGSRCSIFGAALAENCLF